ncbi:MAG: hypothetical protein ABH862_06060 [Candidatus Omnitrophota bacterium]
MKKTFWLVLSFLALIVITFSVTCRVFESSFAEATIDWFAFLAGIFLMVEGLYKFFTFPSPLLRDQIMRMFRVIIGTCVFTIHLLQFTRF